MSWGTPAIVSRVSGVEDIVIDRASGLVFDPGDERGYVAALTTAMAMTDEGWQAMSVAAFETVQRRFAIEASPNGTSRIYERLLQRGVARRGSGAVVSSLLSIAILSLFTPFKVATGLVQVRPFDALAGVALVWALTRGKTFPAGRAAYRRAGAPALLRVARACRH